MYFNLMIRTSIQEEPSLGLVCVLSPLNALVSKATA